MRNHDLKKYGKLKNWEFFYFDVRGWSVMTFWKTPLLQEYNKICVFIRFSSNSKPTREFNWQLLTYWSQIQLFDILNWRHNQYLDILNDRLSWKSTFSLRLRSNSNLPVFLTENHNFYVKVEFLTFWKAAILEKIR